MAKCSLKGIPNNTIDGVRVSVGDNLWEKLSIF